MHRHINQKGFSIIEFVLVLALLGVLGFAGYTVHNHQKKTTSGTITSSLTQPTATVAPAPTISSASDLDKAAATLNQTDPTTSNNTDTSQLDAQLNGF